jgi:MoxR-like ATPase
VTAASSPAGPDAGLSTVADLKRALAEVDYLADDGLAMAAFLALRMGRPLLLEGENGVGKTEIALALSRLLGES